MFSFKTKGKTNERNGFGWQNGFRVYDIVQ